MPEKKTKSLKLNLGCGDDIRQGYLNLDKEDLDLNVFPYRLNGNIIKDNSIDEILLYRVIDHLDEPLQVISELKRILKPDGILKIIVSHKSRSDAFSIAHKYQTNYNSLINICRKWGFNIIHSRIIFGKTYKIFEPIFNRLRKIYEFSFLQSLIPALEINIVLSKKTFENDRKKFNYL